MKQISLILILLFLTVGFTSIALADNDVDINVNITIVNSELSIRSDFPEVNWGVTLGGFNISTSNYKGCIVNDGNVIVDLSVKCIEPSGWTASDDITPGASEFVLQGVFCLYNRDLVDANFGAEDIINDTLSSCSLTAYAADPEPEVYRTGYNVWISQILNMRFRFHAPSTGAAVGDAKTIKVQVHAVAH